MSGFLLFVTRMKAKWERICANGATRKDAKWEQVVRMGTSLSLLKRIWNPRKALHSHKLATIRVHSCVIFAALIRAYADCFTDSGGGFGRD